MAGDRTCESEMISRVLTARAPRSACCGFFMWLLEPSSSPAPHLDGQRWLSGGMFQPCAAAASGRQSRASAISVFFMSISLWYFGPMNRMWGVACAVLLVLQTAGTDALAQGYPQRPVRVIVPYPPGSGTDIVARLLGQKLTESWGQPVVVENRPGAGAIVGVEAPARAAPDGYTIGIADTGPVAINPALYPKLPYDPIRDFAPIIEIAKLPFMLVVHPSLGVSSVGELIAAAR